MRVWGCKQAPQLTLFRGEASNAPWSETVRVRAGEVTHQPCEQAYWRTGNANQLASATRQGGAEQAVQQAETAVEVSHLCLCGAEGSHGALRQWYRAREAVCAVTALQ
jgi:hypothetical protein